MNRHNQSFPLNVVQGRCYRLRRVITTSPANPIMSNRKCSEGGLYTWEYHDGIIISLQRMFACVIIGLCDSYSNAPLYLDRRTKYEKGKHCFSNDVTQCQKKGAIVCKDGIMSPRLQYKHLFLPSSGVLLQAYQYIMKLQLGAVKKK